MKLVSDRPAKGKRRRSGEIHMTQDNLKEELKTYEDNKEKLVAESEGKYVLISGKKVLSTWETYEDALQAGYTACGLKPFLVKKIEGIESVQFFTRSLHQCQS